MGVVLTQKEKLCAGQELWQPCSQLLHHAEEHAQVRGHGEVTPGTDLSNAQSWERLKQQVVTTANTADASLNEKKGRKHWEEERFLHLYQI